MLRSGSSASFQKLRSGISNGGSRTHSRQGSADIGGAANVRLGSGQTTPRGDRAFSSQLGYSTGTASPLALSQAPQKPTETRIDGLGTLSGNGQDWDYITPGNQNEPANYDPTGKSKHKIGHKLKRFRSHSTRLGAAWRRRRPLYILALIAAIMMLLYIYWDEFVKTTEAWSWDYEVGFVTSAPSGDKSPHNTQHFPDTELPQFYVIIDAGSSGSRIHIYEATYDESGELEALEAMRIGDDREMAVLKIEPGLSSYSQTPTDAVTSLKELIDYAENLIPITDLPKTNLYVLATAGLRLLDDKTRLRLQKAIEDELPHQTAMKLVEVDTLDGQWEAVYAWLSFNWMQGKIVKEFENKNTHSLPGQNFPSGHKTWDEISSFPVIDMGGASAQIAMEVPGSPGKLDLDENDPVVSLQLSSDHPTYRLFIHSYIRFGANQARKRYLRWLLAKESGKGNAQGDAGSRIHGDSIVLKDPCLHPDRSDDEEIDKLKVSVEGTGNFYQCAENLKFLFDKTAPCSNKPCAFNGVHQPELPWGTHEIFGISEFWYTSWDVFHFTGPYDEDTFVKAAEAWCLRDWDALVEEYDAGLFPTAGRTRFRDQCFKSAWMHTFLHYAFEMPKSATFHPISKVNGAEVSWTLGALLHRIYDGITEAPVDDEDEGGDAEQEVALQRKKQQQQQQEGTGTTDEHFADGPVPQFLGLVWYNWMVVCTIVGVAVYIWRRRQRNTISLPTHADVNNGGINGDPYRQIYERGSMSYI
eukprot:Clim_evm34s243 gene=Clim_evmTU34s243